MINRRFNDRASCFAQRRLYCKGKRQRKATIFCACYLKRRHCDLIERVCADQLPRWDYLADAAEPAVVRERTGAVPAATRFW
jgi:hypothetical protein